MYSIGECDKKHMKEAVNKAIDFFDGQVDFERTVMYVKSLGLSVCYFDTPQGLELAEEIGLSVPDAFENRDGVLVYHKNTYTIFLRSKLDEESRTYTLLCELGHKVLKRLELEVDFKMLNAHRTELEAYAFAYLVLAGQKI